MLLFVLVVVLLLLFVLFPTFAACSPGSRADRSQWFVPAPVCAGGLSFSPTPTPSIFSFPLFIPLSFFVLDHFFFSFPISLSPYPFSSASTFRNAVDLECSWLIISFLLRGSLPFCSLLYYGVQLFKARLITARRQILFH